jgi:hypothetical protein
MIHRREALRRSLPVLVAVTGGIGLGACRAAPVYETIDGQFQGRASLAEREAQIRRAAASADGWSVQPIRPGQLRATNTWRSHIMTVDITFDVRTFSIRYASSVNLDYDGTRIHQNYNTRVQALERAIMASSATPAAAATAPPGRGGRGGSDAVPVSGPVVSGE